MCHCAGAQMDPNVMAVTGCNGVVVYQDRDRRPKFRGATPATGRLRCADKVAPRQFWRPEGAQGGEHAGVLPTGSYTTQLSR